MKSSDQRTCACPSDDAHECIRIRYPINRVGMRDSFEALIDEPCYCVCHDHRDEDDYDVS